MLGIWRNVAELEEAVNLPELELIVSAARDKEDRANRWLAAVNGIDLSKDNKEENQVNAFDLVEEKKRRLEAEKAGMSKEEFEFDEFGLDIEIEE